MDADAKDSIHIGWKADDNRTVRHFSRLLERFGNSAKSLDWSNEISQHLRFRILSEVGHLSGTKVLDVGCGLGDMWDWLKRNGIDVDYTGIDITPAMISAARARFPSVEFVPGDVFDEKLSSSRFDYVLSSGLFYYRQEYPLRFMKATIRKMFEIATKAVAFNSLSEWASNKESGEFYADPTEILTFCKGVSSELIFRHDYHPCDFSMYLFKHK